MMTYSIFLLASVITIVIGVDTTSTSSSISDPSANKDFPTSNTCPNNSKLPTSVSDCNKSSSDKCCFIKSTDQVPKLVCVQATGDKKVDQETDVKKNYKTLNSVDCGQDPKTSGISSSTATKDFPTTSGCNTALLNNKNPTQTSDCNTDSSSMCCYIKSIDTAKNDVCVIPNGSKKVDQESDIKNTYKNLSNVDCGSDPIVKSISDSSAKTDFPKASNCNLSILGTRSPTVGTDCYTTTDSKCCFIKSTDSQAKFACINTTGTGKVDQESYIKKTYINLAALDCGNEPLTAEFPTSNTCSKLTTSPTNKEACYTGQTQTDLCCYITSKDKTKTACLKQIGVTDKDVAKINLQKAYGDKVDSEGIYCKSEMLSLSIISLLTLILIIFN
jgi:hypothetical protein